MICVCLNMRYSPNPLVNPIPPILNTPFSWVPICENPSWDGWSNGDFLHPNSQVGCVSK